MTSIVVMVIIVDLVVVIVGSDGGAVDDVACVVSPFSRCSGTLQRGYYDKANISVVDDDGDGGEAMGVVVLIVLW